MNKAERFSIQPVLQATVMLACILCSGLSVIDVGFGWIMSSQKHELMDRHISALGADTYAAYQRDPSIREQLDENDRAQLDSLLSVERDFPRKIEDHWRGAFNWALLSIICAALFGTLRWWSSRNREQHE